MCVKCDLSIWSRMLCIEIQHSQIYGYLRFKTIGTKQTKIEPMYGFSRLQISFILHSMVSLPQVDNCEN